MAWFAVASLLLTLIACEDEAVPSRSAQVQPDAECLLCGADTGNTGLDSNPFMPSEDTDVAPDTASPDTGTQADTTVEEDTPPVELSQVVVTVETLLGAESIQAGNTVMVACQGLNADGEPVSVINLESRINISPEGSFEGGQQPGLILPTRSGQANVTCALPELGLIDATPARLDITPGPPHTLLTELDKHNAQAGEPIEATCTTYDAYGNLILDAEPRLLIDPFGGGVETEGQSLTITRSGLYTVACHVDGAEVEIADIVEVSPGPPTSLVLSVFPDQPSYRIGQLVEVLASVEDAWSNEVPTANIAFTSNPAGTSFGEGRFRYAAEGVYGVGVTVTREGDEPLTDGVAIVVNETGPAIECLNPSDGQMITAAEGSSITIAGTVTDANGIGDVRVNGNLASVGGTGTFQINQPVRFGVNFVDIEATDEFGEVNSRTCAFMAANSWAEEQTLMNDAVTLRMAQSAFDDGNRAGGIGSIGDLLHTTINSPNLISTLDSTLSNANPLINRCVQDTFLGCAFRLRVDYQSLSNRQTNTVSVDLESGGMRIVATIPELWARIGIGGTVSTNGWVKVYGLTVDLSFDVSLQNNRPQVTLDRIHRVDVSRIDTDFSGLAGFVIDIIVDLFNGTFQNLLKDQLRNYIRDSFDAILDGVLSGLDISSLGSSFNVPRLSGDGDIRLGFGLGFSHLNFNNNRALFGLGLRFTARAAHSIPSPGVPMPSGTVRLDPSTTRPLVAGIHVGVLNQALHTLWRAGLLEVTLGGDDVGGGLPDGTNISVRALMPPVVRYESGGGAKAMLGGIRAEVVYPGIFETPISVSLGGTANTGVRLVGETLEFEDIAIDELYFSTDDIALDPNTRAILEDLLRMLLQSILDDALNGALPVLPIPAFDLPASLSTYGLPGGQTLGIIAPSLSTSANHAILEGGFGIQ